MTATATETPARRAATILLLGTMLGGISQPLYAQGPASDPPPAQESVSPAAAPAASAPAVAQSTTIRTVNVVGAQRLEPDTVRSYIKLAAGGPYSRELGDQALKDLYATDLFADVTIRDQGNGDIVVQVRENPVVNRIVLEGNKRIKEDKIRPEIKLAPRQIFTRAAVRADVARIIELYRRQGRFAASVDPKMVRLDQNRVDVVFEISEGPKSKVRKINIIGNERFSDGRLRGEMATKQAGLTKIFSSGTSYDPDRLSYDQQKLRQFYLTNGYADFRVVSAVAELTPDRRDFIITYVVQEGERYRYGDVDVQSDIRDIPAAGLRRLLPMKPGDWYNAKQVEDTNDAITESAGLLGFTPDVSPQFRPDKTARTMSVTFKVNEAPRVYVERIDVNGNTITRDKVVRREMRLSEGDAFNSFRVKRSRDRIQSLGFFQEKFEIEQKPGSAPDRVVLEANVEEKSTGQIQVSAGFSSLEKFIVNLSVEQSNFRGKGQTVRAGVDYSTYSKSVNLGFTEPYLLDKNIAFGVDLFRRDYNSFNYVNDDRNTTYKQITTGGQIRFGVPLTEFTILALRYGLSYDEVALDKDRFYSLIDLNGQPYADGVRRCDPFLAGRYLCDALGNRLTSSVGYSIAYNNLNNSIHPTRGNRAILSQDFAGLGGSVRYIKTKVEAAKYWTVLGNFVFSVRGEAGYIHSLEGSRGEGVDKVRLTDRWFLGEPQMRGFDIRGIGPRVQRFSFDANGNVDTSSKPLSDDALGGRAYYVAHLELEIPLGAGARELGLRPSIFTDVGAVFGLKRPRLTSVQRDVNGIPLPIDRGPLTDSNGNTVYVTPTVGTTPGVNTLCQFGVAGANGVCPTSGIENAVARRTIAPFFERYVGNTPKPRLSVGFGVNWNSPFGPLRVDIARALLKETGDDTKLFTFNVGTQF